MSDASARTEYCCIPFEAAERTGPWDTASLAAAIGSKAFTTEERRFARALPPVHDLRPVDAYQPLYDHQLAVDESVEAEADDLWQLALGDLAVQRILALVDHRDPAVSQHLLRTSRALSALRVM